MEVSGRDATAKAAIALGLSAGDGPTLADVLTPQ